MAPRKIALALGLLLAGCASPQPMKAMQDCPVPQVWSADDQKALAAQLEPLPPDSPVWRMEKSWQTMCDELRACRS